jgi:hypothetical protein
MLPQMSLLRAGQLRQANVSRIGWFDGNPRAAICVRFEIGCDKFNASGVQPLLQIRLVLNTPFVSATVRVMLQVLWGEMSRLARFRLLR